MQTNNLEKRRVEGVKSLIPLLVLANGVFRKAYGLELKAGNDMWWVDTSTDLHIYAAV